MIPEDSLQGALPLRLRAERRAIASSCCGFTGEAVLTESAVIMLYAGMLGAGEALKLLTTAVFPFLSGLLMIPMAFLTLRGTCRGMTFVATLAAGGAAFLAVLAPMFGIFRVTALCFALAAFAVSLSGFVAGWFPLLDTFLLPERRTVFLGRMRFCHQSCAVLFLVLAGCWLGREPLLGQLQLVIALAAVIFLGRALFIALLPRFREERPADLGWRDGIQTAWHNRKLRNGAGYLAGLNLAAYGITPLWILYLQKNGQPDHVLIYISAAALSGMMLGYLAAGKYPVKDHIRMLGILHWALLILTAVLLVLPTAGNAAAVLCGAVLGGCNFCIALISVSASALMLSAATPGNKTMAMALFGALGNTGMGASRCLGALLIHSPLALQLERCGFCNIFQLTLLSAILLLGVLLLFRGRLQYAAI